MEIFIAALIFIGLSIFGMCFNIIFRKNGKFPETEISRNKDMRKMGIHCAKEDELKMWKNKKHRKSGQNCSDMGCSDCFGCDINYGKTKEKE